MLSMFFYFFRDHETVRQEQKGLGGGRMGGEWQMKILRKIPRATSGETQGLPFLLSYVTGFAMEPDSTEILEGLDHLKCVPLQERPLSPTITPTYK